MVDFFLDETLSEISGAYSVMENTILLGDYNSNYFQQKIRLFISVGYQ